MRDPGKTRGAKKSRARKKAVPPPNDDEEQELLRRSLARAREFFFSQLEGVSIDRLDDEIHRAVVALLCSDIPLEDRQLRRWIAHLYWSLAFPNSAAARENKRKAEVDKELKARLQERGMTAQHADEHIAEIMTKLAGRRRPLSVYAVQKRRQPRHR